MPVADPQPGRNSPPGALSATLPGERGAAADGERDGVEWVLRRNCCLTPRQLVVACLAVGGTALAIASLFWWMGATLVVPFACIEMLALGTALLVHARHTLDREILLLRDGRLSLQRICGGRSERVDFDAAWVRVTARCGGSLVELTGGGRQASVGRFVSPGTRVRLACELRSALRGATR
jgi:uncharacterized membrane protein